VDDKIRRTGPERFATVLLSEGRRRIVEAGTGTGRYGKSLEFSLFVCVWEQSPMYGIGSRLKQGTIPCTMAAVP
jgi:hypothetical protein